MRDLDARGSCENGRVKPFRVSKLVRSFSCLLHRLGPTNRRASLRRRAARGFVPEMGPPGREAEAEDAAASDRAPFRVSSCGDTTPFDHDRFARMRAHAAFVPTLVLERLAADPHAPAEPYETSFPAAVMFVDIAGYVRLSGATHRGVARRETRMETQSRGLRRKSSGRWRRGEKEGDDDPGSRVAGLAGEAMRDVVSACFAAIVEIVSRHGGDVVKFAGDALFVAWPAGKDRLVDRRREEKESDLNRNRNRNRNRDETPSFETETYDETLGETALRAVQCGLAIQACAREHEAFEGLQLKLVIGAGRARGVNVGGVDDRWEYAIAGEPVTQIARCAPFAAPGEVVVSPECARLEEMQDHAETTLVCQKDGGHVAGSEEDAESDESSFEDAADPPDGTADRPRSEYVSSILRAETSASLRGRAGSGGAFRFPSARLLFAGALRLGAFAGDKSSSAAGAPKAPRRAESSFETIRSYGGGGDGASNRGLRKRFLFASRG
jgi:class 3 adenylate cyclase